LPESFDASALRTLALPPTLGAEFWSQQIEAGLKALSALPEERLLTLRYEDLLCEPKAQLDTLAAFLGQDLLDDAWSTRCAAAVGKPQSSWRDLPEETARALTDACRPAFAQLRAAGVNYDV
jgi:putative sulfotransferase